jgi:hypothetical protein
MDHDRIEEEQVAERYVLGRLAPAEEASFEEHLLTCAECRERVAWAGELHGSLRAMAAEDHGSAARLGLLAWLVQHRRAARFGLTAVCVALLVLVGMCVGLLLEQGRLRRQLVEARAGSVGATAAGSRSGAAPAHPAANAPPPPARPQAAAERALLAAQLQRREDELRRERRRGDDLRARLAEIARPQVNAVIASLGLVRGQGETTRVAVGPLPAWIVLSIELPAPGGGAWQATLLDGRGRTIWSGGGLRPGANDTLALGLHSSLVPPGVYRLLLDRPGDPPQHSEIPFEVVTR